MHRSYIIRERNQNQGDSARPSRPSYMKKRKPMPQPHALLLKIVDGKSYED